MDRQPILGNRVVHNYMKERQNRRLLERLKNIKRNRSQYSSIGVFKEKPRANSLFFQSIPYPIKENQQIEKQNIALFNRIASIIKKNPKIQTENQTSMQKSRQTSIVFHRKIQSSLEEQNKLIQKRLSSQKPTINNKLFYQERAKHMKYLKSMGRYPYILNKKMNTQPDVNAFDDQNNNYNEFPPVTNIKGQFENHQNKQGVKQLFRHQSLDFTILVTMDMRTDICTFSIQANQSNPETYILLIPKSQFIQYFQESQYDYEKMIGNLRLNDEGNVQYVREKETKTNHTPKQEKQAFKFKAQSTAYTSTGFKTGFRSNKRNILLKSENQVKGNSKTDRKITKYHVEDKIESRKQSDTLSENKFAQINIISKD